MTRPIPAILSIDVEPDGFQLGDRATASTTGYDTAVELFERLRPRLADATGRPVSFGWFFRMDPQIERVYGRADHLADGYGDRVARLLDAGDHVGLHTHAIRWDPARDAWVHETTDHAWIDEAYGSSYAAFERCFGRACERHRNGAGIYDQFVVDTLARLGTKVDTALERRRGWAAEARINTGVDASPTVAASGDCSGAPRHAYRPTAGAFLRPAAARSGMVLVPATTSRLRHGQSTLRAVAGTAKRRSRPPVRMLYPDSYADPASFWDLVARQLRLMRRPYVNIAIRTDAPGSRQFRTAGAVFEALAEHPLARRLQVVDPLAALPDLLGERPSPAEPPSAPAAVAVANWV